MLNDDEPQINNPTRFADYAGSVAGSTKDENRAASDAETAQRDPPPAGSLDSDLFEHPKHNRGVFYRGALSVIAVVLIIVGVILIPLPVVTGFPLILAGALMLAASNAFARARMNQAERLFPNRFRRFIRKWMVRLTRKTPLAERDKVHR